MHKILLLFLFSFSALAHSAHYNATASDQEALLSLKDFITYDPHYALQGWNPNSTFCNWTGVKCSSHRVIGLNLTGMSLGGTISPLVGNLSLLQILDLSYNTLRGPIPKTLANCHWLVRLYLEENQLSGRVPSELGLLSHLELLYLGYNSLGGTIPLSLANMSSLIALHLAANNISGIIPPQLGQLNHLEFLHLGDNLFTGQIPTTLFNCTLFQDLVLYNNQLTGSISEELGSKLANLQTLYLWGNRLSGRIPSSLANCSQLYRLILSGNQLSGATPLEFGRLRLLEELELSSNMLVSGSVTNWPFLTALINCSRLTLFDFSSNQLSGVLPPTVGLLSPKFSILDLSNNDLGGNIPPQIANLTNLTFLNLSSNHFTGSIPSSFRSLKKLERFFLDYNELQESIPVEIGQVENLGELSITYNMLSGQIPDTIGNLQQLRRLHFHHNRLSGNIPSSLGKCLLLELLDLSYNALNGTIPPAVAGLPNLVFYLNLSSNSLQGSLPPEIGKLLMVQGIDISANNLSGHIPYALGSCISLQYLNLSWNSLEGPVPLSFKNLISLEDVDLSSNNLSGTIPEPLANLKMLRQLNFSFNNLVGEIPKEGFFANLSAASFMGNPGLCGIWIHLPACSTHHNSHHNSLLIITIIPPVAAIFILCLMLVIYWRHSSSKHFFKMSLDLRLGSYRKISYHELVNATNGFSGANLLGVGNFGSVYKGVLGDGTMLAVKILNLQSQLAEKSFTTECKVLGRVRHRNLVGILTSCSNPQFKALILQFMSNGSLEKCLYGHGDKGNRDEHVCGLSIIDRLNIAIDIAHGMNYLHHDCFFQVVHCDLKPANVLFDENMTAHITDFGISRLACANSMESFTSTAALKGTIGYIAPEYGLDGRLSTKGDVYSYGVVLLEMLTRKKPTSDIFVGEMNLHRWVSMAFPNRLMEIVDKGMLREMSDDGSFELQHEVWTNILIPLVHVGLLCTKESAEERPTMREVVGALESIRGFLRGRTGLSKQTFTLSNLLDSTSVAMKNEGAVDSETSSTL